MKTNIRNNTMTEKSTHYTVLSVRELKNLLKIAVADSLDIYGKIDDKSNTCFRLQEVKGYTSEGHEQIIIENIYEVEA